MARPVKLLETEQTEAESADWTFAAAPTRELTHCYHDYPARMIPQVAGRLLDMFASKNTFLLDPYCGSGSSLVEGMVRGVNVIGIDLNPLACLISKAKISTPDTIEIDRKILDLEKYLPAANNRKVPLNIPGISRLDFWFKPQVIEKLSVLKRFVDGLSDKGVRLFFQVAFSETVRESSNTRNEEFKLYRYDAERLEKFDPDVFGIMLAKLRRNRIGLQQFLSCIEKFESPPTAHVYEFDSASENLFDVVSEASADVLITSPPYGDSHTTVAYGQYSRLSSAWLGLKSPESVDRRLMGGSAIKSIPHFPSLQLNQALQTIEQVDEKRALEVAAFYSDLQASISHVARLIKPLGHACYVVGNRRVKGTTLPTDDAIRKFFERLGFAYVNTYHRSIPNKRMPLRNSPTNATGIVENTMTTESIVVMRKLK